MIRILLSDNDPAIVDALTLALEDEGYQVDSVKDSSILHMASEMMPDLILLDIWLDHEDGGKVCSQLKQTAKTASIPVLLISANKNIAAISLARKADGFISKPFSISELLEKIEALLNRP